MDEHAKALTLEAHATEALVGCLGDLDAAEVFAVPLRRFARSLARNMTGRQPEPTSTEFDLTFATPAEIRAAQSLSEVTPRRPVRSRPPPPLVEGRQWLALTWTSRHVQTLKPICSLLARAGRMMHITDLAFAGSLSWNPPHAGDFAQLVRDRFTRQTKDLSAPSISQMTVFCESFSRVLDEMCPGLVLLANDTNPHARAAILLAQARGIATVHVQHGAWVRGEVPREEVRADHVLTISRGDREWAETWDGAENAGFEVVSHPRLSAIARRAHRRGHGVLLAAQTLDRGVCLRQALDVVEAARALARPVIIAEHPGQRPGLYSLLGIDVTVRHGLGCEGAVLDDAAVLVTAYSTASLEALVAHVPVVEQRYLCRCTLGLAERAGAIAAEKPGDLVEAIKAAIANGPPTPEIVDDLCGCPWQDSAARSATYIMALP